MSDEKSKQIFAYNLNSIMDEQGKTAANINADLGVPYSTISNWTSGQKLPRMGSIEMLAKYLHCKKSDLLEEHSEKYYENKETAILAQRIKDNHQLKALFDIQSDMSPEDLNAIYHMALVLKQKEGNMDE